MIAFISRQFISSRYWLDIRTWRRIYLAQRVHNNRRIYWWLLYHPTILPRTHVLVGKVNRIPGPASPTMIHTVDLSGSDFFCLCCEIRQRFFSLSNKKYKRVFLLHFILCTQLAMILPHFNDMGQDPLAGETSGISSFLALQGVEATNANGLIE